MFRLDVVGGNRSAQPEMQFDFCMGIRVSLPMQFAVGLDEQPRLLSAFPDGTFCGGFVVSAFPAGEFVQTGQSLVGMPDTDQKAITVPDEGDADSSRGFAHWRLEVGGWSLEV